MLDSNVSSIQSTPFFPFQLFPFNFLFSMECKVIGHPDPDVAGIGVLLSFAAQAFLTLMLAAFVFFLSWRGRLDVTHEKGSREYNVQAGKLRIVNNTMMAGHDVQMVLGISLIIYAFSASANYDLYHLRLIYETVTFAGTSGAAGIIIWTYTAYHVTQTPSKRNSQRTSRLSPRHKVIYVYTALYIAYTIWICVKLSKWNLEEEGRCYITTYTARSNASHPAADIVYVAISSVYMIICMLYALFGKAKHIKQVLATASLQFVPHLYMMIALRVDNSSRLEGTEKEDDWRFGQTVAVVLLFFTIREMINGVRHYINYEKILSKKEGRVDTVDFGKLTEIQEHASGRV